MSAREHILIVEDDSAIRNLLKAEVENQGFHARVCENGADALQMALQSPPILVFLDIGLPEMDGVELMRELRKSNETVPVVVVTGMANQELFRQLLPHRIADFVAKPFGLEQIRASIRNALGRDEEFVNRFLDVVTHRLREARTTLGLKQSEVASRCGLSTSQVSQIELRQSSTSVVTLLKLCKSLNLTMSELVRGF